MNFILTIDEYNIKNVYFTDSLENTVMDDGIFSKILYSNSEITLNGIYLLCNFNNTTVEKISHNKFKVSWNKEKNIKLIEKIKLIENNLLKKYGYENMSLQLSNLVENANFRIFTDNEKLNSNTDFLLRISGIWENKNQCGITYKFLELNNI